MFELRPYQQELVDKLRSEFSKAPSTRFPHGRRVVCCLPTGGGKTIVFTHIANGAIAKGKSVLILVHRNELLDQCANKLRQYGVEPYCLSAGADVPTTETQIVVASIDTLRRRLQLIDPQRFHLVIVDECHHAFANTWQEAINHFHCPVLGVTATPERADGEPLGDMFEEPIVPGPTVRELQDMGFLSRFDLYSIPLGEEEEREARKQEEEEEREERILLSPDVDSGEVTAYRLQEDARDRDLGKVQNECLSHYLKLIAPVGNGTAILYCKSLSDAERYSQYFRDNGIPAENVDGATHPSERKRILDQLRSGIVKVVFNCQVLTEGFDAPDLVGVAVLRKTGSLPLWLQMCGRALRTADGKPYGVIIDHGDNFKTHGSPLREVEWSLAGRDKREGKFPEPKVTEGGLPLGAAPVKNYDLVKMVLENDEVLKYRPHGHKYNLLRAAAEKGTKDDAMEMALRLGLRPQVGGDLWEGCQK